MTPHDRAIELLSRCREEMGADFDHATITTILETDQDERASHRVEVCCRMSAGHLVAFAGIDLDPYEAAVAAVRKTPVAGRVL